MATPEEIQQFLQDFKIKLEIWGIVFRDDRNKNTQALLNLEITTTDRINILKGIEIKDYCEGPLEEKFMNGVAMWVFGKLVKGKEVYIKITLGMAGGQVICISFHIAEFVLKYPLKK